MGLKKIQPIDPVKEAQRLLAELRISKGPVPVERVAKHIDALVRNIALDDEISGMVFIKNDQAVIGVNSLHHPNRQRFTIAHEIGHLVMHSAHLAGSVHVDKSYRVLMRDTKSSHGVDLMEVQANQFAAELLMPRKLIALAVKDQPIDLEDEESIDALATEFKVSKQAMTYRLSSLFAFA
jgi:Zn-dependent peptidase ImmA (M78 family)